MGGQQQAGNWARVWFPVFVSVPDWANSPLDFLVLVLLFSNQFKNGSDRGCSTVIAERNS